MSDSVEGNGLETTAMDTLVSKMIDKLVVSADSVNWEEADRNLK